MPTTYETLRADIIAAMKARDTATATALRTMDAAIQRVKRRVSIEQYQMFDLFVLKQWPARYVATTLGVTIGHVYVAKHRVSKLVRQEVAALDAKDS